MRTDNSLNLPVDARVEPLNANHESRVGLLDLLLTLAEWKRFILSMTAAGGLATAVIALLIKPQFTATTVIMPPQQQQSTAAALIGQLGAVAGMTGSAFGLKSPSDLYIGILGGRTIADTLVKKFDLNKRYEVHKDSDARKSLASHTTFASGKDSLIKISVEDQDPNVAAEIANAYVDELQVQINRLALTESARRRIFFERQLDNQKKALADSEVALKSTQEHTGVLQVNTQVESVIRAIAELRAAVVSREVALRALENSATNKNPEVIQQQTELAELRTQLRKLEASSADSHSGDPFISLSRAPKAGMDYIRALRDLKYNETLFELLSKQYEIARIDEAKEGSVIQVVDTAAPPDGKSWPPRAVLTLLGAFGCGLLACIVALGSRPFIAPAQAEKVRQLRRLTSFCHHTSR